MKYAGADWISQSGRRAMSSFGRAVADLLGDWSFGIYHIDRAALHQRVKWDATDYIDIVVPDSRLATFDADGLTRLVVLCHDRCIRCELQGCGRRYVRMRFHPRHSRSGEAWQRHPTMASATETIREHYAAIEEPLRA